METLKNGQKVRILIGTYEGTIGKVVGYSNPTQQLVKVQIAGDETLEFPRIYLHSVRNSDPSVRYVA